MVEKQTAGGRASAWGVWEGDREQNVTNIKLHGSESHRMSGGGTGQEAEESTFLNKLKNRGSS